MVFTPLDDRWSIGCSARVWSGLERRRRRSSDLSGSSLHPSVHRLIGKAVGVLIFVTKGVRDLEAVELGDAAFGLIIERAKIG